MGESVAFGCSRGTNAGRISDRTGKQTTSDGQMATVPACSNSNSCGGEPSAGSQGKLLPSGWGETSYASALGLWDWRGGDGSQAGRFTAYRYCSEPHLEHVHRA